ncbi:MAG: HAAS signaling domain-containing protein [Nocardioidaceae bacterium]
MNQQPDPMHPLVARYLHDLDALLHSLEPVERTEVVEGVREHIETTLEGTDRTDADVRSALNDVGPATAVAEEAYSGRPAPGVAPRRRLTSRAWLPSAVAGFEAVALLVVTFVMGSIASVSEGSSSATTASGRTITTDTHGSFDGSIAGAVVAVLAATPFWLIVVVLVGASALWTAREKTVLIALPLAAVLVMTGLPLIGYALVGINGVYVGGWIALVLALAGGGFLVWLLARRAIRRSGAFAT